MAIINLTCDFPNEYCFAELARWAKISTHTVRKLCKDLDLDIIKKRGEIPNAMNRLSNYFKKEYGNRNNNW